MSGGAHTVAEAAVVTSQLGRSPREPWRVAVRCRWGLPSVIASPSRLADGTPFPTLFWLTCPWIAEGVSAVESGGGAATWARTARSDAAVASLLRDADAALRQARRAESGREDTCETVGIGGQRDPLGVKCLHVHAAAFLAGIDDPVGRAVVGNTGDACPDARCARFAPGEETA